MSAIHIVETSLHRIDLEEETIGERIVVGSDTDFRTYVGKLIEDMYESNRYKSYKFSSNETEIVRQVLAINSECWIEKSQIIAERLLRIEKAAQERVQHLTELRVGSLVQILVTVDGQKNLIITKVDHSPYLDEVSLMEKLGLPVNQRAQKTAIISYEDETTIGNVRLGDTNKKISEYWWKHFFEVEELKSSEKNTELAFLTIDKVLRKDVRKVSKSDFWTLRNAVISYFRTNESCTFDTLVDSVFNDYQPDNQELNMEKIKQQILALPEKYKFDSQFDISPSSIKAKIKDQIKLAENLELKITGEINNLSSLIDTGEAENGRKYIRIFSEAGYAEFNKTLEVAE